MSTNPLQQTLDILKEARDRAEALELERAWQKYEEENRRHLDRVRFNFHGTKQTYKRGCRCQECRAANAKYMREYRHAKGLSKRRYKQRSPQEDLEEETRIAWERYEKEMEVFLYEVRRRHQKDFRLTSKGSRRYYEPIPEEEINPPSLKKKYKPL